MSDAVIKVEGLGKRYRIGANRERYVALRDVVTNGARSLGRRLLGRGPARSNFEDFWALRDISFEVNRGECVGIIGRNGAGKSTLLKLLSRITEPTTGRFRVKGRVASLLEVGTGFHPELTGRENVFLNGAILGMGRREIARKFDEIVAFAEVEKFLETPVKYYSSGMYMRLAFAVAAHLEPEILIVDEVLAVGDAEFQKKCLGKMSEVAKGGRTVLFVSHNMNAIEALTHRCLLMQSGALRYDGPTRGATEVYLADKRKIEEKPNLRLWQDRKRTPTAEIVGVECQGSDGQRRQSFAPLEQIQVCLEIEFVEPTTADVAVVVETASEQPLFTTHLSDTREVSRVGGHVRFVTTINPNPLRQGLYLVSLAVGNSNWTNMFDVVYHYPLFEVTGHPESGFFPLDARWGPLFFTLPWSTDDATR
jgi:lipopolysaccharide transport system ATP-binding protein